MTVEVLFVCRYVCFVDNVDTVSRTALIRVRKSWIKNCVITVGKQGTHLLIAPNLFKKVISISVDFGV